MRKRQNQFHRGAAGPGLKPRVYRAAMIDDIGDLKCRILPVADRLGPTPFLCLDSCTVLRREACAKLGSEKSFLHRNEANLLRFC